MCVTKPVQMLSNTVVLRKLREKNNFFRRDANDGRSDEGKKEDRLTALCGMQNLNLYYSTGGEASCTFPVHNVGLIILIRFLEEYYAP